MVDRFFDRLALLTPPEVGRRAGISSAVVRRLIAAGELPSIVVGGRARVPLRLLESWIDANAGRAAGRTQRGIL